MEEWVNRVNLSEPSFNTSAISFLFVWQREIKCILTLAEPFANKSHYSEVYKLLMCRKHQNTMAGSSSWKMHSVADSLMCFFGVKI